MSYLSRDNREQNLGSVQQDDAADGVFTCGFCKDTFNSRNGLRDHKREMAANESKQEGSSSKALKHIYCHVCDKDFASFTAGHKHWIQYHSEKQSISCPGCQTAFVNYSDFIKHIECNECPKITQDNAAARCRKSIEFAKALGAIDAQRPELFTSKGPKDFGCFLGGDLEPITPLSWVPVETSPWCQQDPSGWNSPEGHVLGGRDFPTIIRPNQRSGSSQPPSTHKEVESSRLKQQHKNNAWTSTQASAKTLFPNAATARAPTIEQLDCLRTQQINVMERARADQTDPDHPNSPYFSAERYWNAYTKKYKCPRDRCKKTFLNKGALIQHLQSPTHTFGKVYTCPNCLKRFPALYALAAHCESASERCHIRDSDMYERFLSQLTWNLVEVTGEHEKDGTPKYGISTSAKIDYGLQKDLRPTFGHQQVYGAGNYAKAATPDDNGSQERLMLRRPVQGSGLPQQQQTISVGRQPMQCAGGTSVPLTAEALAMLDLQRSQRTDTGRKQEGPAKRVHQQTLRHGQGHRGLINKAGFEEEEEADW